MEVIIQTVRKVVENRKEFFTQEGNIFAYTEVFQCIPFTCYLQVNEAINVIQFRAYTTFSLDNAHQEQMQIYLSNLNYNLAVGCFVYGPEKSELRYKNNLAFNQERPTENSIETLVKISEAIINEEIHGLIKIHNGVPAHEVLSLPKVCT